jgi:hypothetical protein
MGLEERGEQILHYTSQPSPQGLLRDKQMESVNSSNQRAERLLHFDRVLHQQVVG